MLSTIYIKNFAIVDEETITFNEGLNVISGETGAGKSILIGALGLQLGDRADNSWIRNKTHRCEIQSNYYFPDNSVICSWLKDNEFDDDEDGCQLRRTLLANGKSRCYINGIPTTLGNTKIIGEALVDIHGQHSHQSLTIPEKQLELLDNFAGHDALIDAVKSTYQSWQQLLKKQLLLQGDDNLTDKYELLHYQLQELNNADIEENEFEHLATKQKRLFANHNTINYAEDLRNLLSGNNDLSKQFSEVLSISEKINSLDENFAEINKLLQQSMIYIDEAVSSINQYINSLEIEPESLHKVENRMTELHDLARKHHIEPNNLIDLKYNLTEQLKNLQQSIEQLKTIDKDIKSAEAAYQHAANNLSQSRQDAAKRLCRAIEQQFVQLSLENANFRIINKSVSPRISGIDSIVFMFTPNPGQGEKPLHKIASGGELSRVSLAIQIASIASKSDTTMIFDEVDSGIGGATAEVVGRLLKTLSQYNQIICVTHLAQVAAFADRHIKINKKIIDDETFTDFKVLTDNERIEELARMSGGIKRDKKTREHAQNMLDNAVQFNTTLTKP